MGKESTLWSEDQLRDTVLLNCVPKSCFDECLQNFINNLYCTDMFDMVEPIEKWLKNKRIEEVEGTVGEYFLSPRKVYNLYKSDKKKEENGFLLLALFFSDPGNLEQLIAREAPFVQSALKKLTGSFFLYTFILCREDIDQVLLSDTNSWQGYILHSPWFKLINIELAKMRGSYRSFISIHPALFLYFYRMYAKKLPLTVENLPDDENLQVFLTEESAIKAYPVVQSLYQQGILTLGKNDKFLISVLRKCARLVALDEFFPNVEEETYRLLRASFAFPFLVHKLRKNSNCKDLQHLLKEKWNLQFLPISNILPLLLPHVKRPNCSYYSFESNYIRLFEDIWAILSEAFSSKKWISIDGLIDQILRREHGVVSLQLYSPHIFGEMKLKNSAKEDEFISLLDNKEEISEPLIKGIMVLLASVGMLDVAYRKASEDDVSWVDGFQYFRMTELGKYVLGLSEKYENKVKTQQLFEVDPDHLIIRALENEVSFESFLQEVAKSIGNHRYVFTETSFLQKCSKKKDVENKIEFFKQFIAAEVSPLWEDFFQSLLEHCSPFERISNQDYEIFKIQPEKSELIRLLNTDKILRKYIIRAENCMILVEHDNWNKFSNRLKSLGFIL